MALPPPKRSERGAFYWFLKSMELSAEFGYTTRLAVTMSPGLQGPLGCHASPLV